MLDLNTLPTFIGRTQSQTDFTGVHRFERLGATLDRDLLGDRPSVVPPLGHWLCFLPGEPQQAFGEDGHPARSENGFLPDIALPRRMCAGSRVQFLQDLPLNAPVERISTILKASPKEGRSGQMVFVTVQHDIRPKGGETAIIEGQDLVYREAAPTGTAFVRNAAPAEPFDGIVRSITPDSRLLFRYSALTFNAHRIHYDREYARDGEGYRGLVVQGPLLATLMVDHLVRETAGRIENFAFRASSPTFADEPIDLRHDVGGGDAQLQIVGKAGDPKDRRLGHARPSANACLCQQAKEGRQEQP